MADGDIVLHRITGERDPARNAFLNLGRAYSAELGRHLSSDECERFLVSALQRQGEPDRWLAVFQCGEAAVGFAQFKIDWDERLGWGCILDFTIAAPWRGQGLGRACAERIREILGARGVTRAWLASLPEAEGFWRACGYQETDEYEGDQRVMIADWGTEIEPDLWGSILADYHAGSREPVTIRRNDGHEDTSTFPAAYFEPPPEADQALLGALRGRALDVGCGPGRHTLWLQERGIEAVGIDNSQGAVDVARTRGCRDVRLMDARHLDFAAASLDGVIMMGNNVGIAGTLAGTTKLFRDLRRVTRTGGLLIGWNRDPLTTDCPEHLAYHEANRRAGHPPGRVVIRFEYRGEVGPWFKLLMLEPERLEGLLRAAGWEPIADVGGMPVPPGYVAARAV